MELSSTSNSFLEKNLSQENWEARYAGQGKLPPAAGASIECEVLDRRWKSLQLTLQKLGPFKKQLIEMNGETEEILRADEFVAVITFGKLKSRNVMEGWLTHLQVCANNKSPAATVVIARSPTKSKDSNFEVAMKWHPLKPQQARRHLNELNSLALQGLEQCWPVPPESGWALAQANQKEPLKRESAFNQKWNGVYKIQGERDRPEMQLCFGAKFEAKEFLNNTDFIEAWSTLYDPLIKNLSYEE